MARTTLQNIPVPGAYGALMLVLVCLLGLSVLLAGDTAGPGEPELRFRFSHRLHVEDVGAECTDCHEAITESVSIEDLVRPDHAVCESCHEDQVNEECSTCHLTDPLEFAVPVKEDRGLTFSHAFHLENGAECAQCHPGMESKEDATPLPPPPMARCNECHNGESAPNNCESCHRDLALLRNEEHNRTDWMRQHKQFALQDDANCRSCHSNEGCEECHNGADLVSVTVPGSDLQVPNGPRLLAMSRGQGQTKLKVHDANWRFSHGVLAEQKTLECQTCHTSQEFCATCHLAGGNINQSVFRPFSHSQPNFTTIGVGSGGGVHAREARRDIESCASCHDVQAADPTCVLCHVDSDGIRGTNPRTHEPGFMRGEEGEWHEDAGANCYVCHVDPNARPGGIRGITFCGYCHT